MNHKTPILERNQDNLIDSVVLVFRVYKILHGGVIFYVAAGYVFNKKLVRLKSVILSL